MGFIVYTTLFLWAIGTGSSDDAAGMAVGAATMAVSLPVLLVLTRNEPPWVRTAILLAFVFKQIGTLARLYFIQDAYGGVADAGVYHQEGARLAGAYLSGDFGADLGRPVPGTGFIRLLTGIIYLITTPTLLGGYFVYSLLSFFGLFLFYRAFVIAVPDGDHKRYLLLLFFLPSLVFWPSSIGKEAWMVLVLGASAFGVARFAAQKRGALAWVVVGAAGALAVRPHLALLVTIAVAGVAILRSSRDRVASRSVLAWLAPVVVIGVIGVIVVSQVEAFFGVDLDGQGLQSVLETTDARSTTGGSAFDNPNPLNVPYAAVTVLYRPFPTEAGNTQGALASLEGLFLLGLTLASWRRLVGLPGLMRGSPYLLYAAIFSVVFILAFSNIGNFGILVRQRTQVFPLFLALLSAPRRRTSR